MSQHIQTSAEGSSAQHYTYADFARVNALHHATPVAPLWSRTADQTCLPIATNNVSVDGNGLTNAQCMNQSVPNGQPSGLVSLYNLLALTLPLTAYM